MLESWNDTATRSAIVEFVRRVTTDGPDFVPPEQRLAVFDNDGTLWSEKPAYVQLDFVIRQLAERAAVDPALLETPPYRAAADGDLAWFGAAVTKHHQGDDADLKLLGDALLVANAAIGVEDHAARVREFFDAAVHPTLQRPYTATGYTPMIELLRYLEAGGFTPYIVSGGGRDFMRPITTSMYGIPPERVVGSSVGLTYHRGQLATTSHPEFLDDGPMKPMRIWDRTGRRPIFAAGNSDGDIEMLEYTAAGSGPSMQLLILHDDPVREFEYVAGAERALGMAARSGWTVLRIKDDWANVFD